MSVNVDQFASRMNQLARTYDAIPKQVVTAAAQVYTNTIRHMVDVSTVGGKLRHVGKSGARIGAKYDVKGSANPTAIVQATGPFQLIERDTKAHQIPRASRTRRGRTPSGRLSHKRVDTGRQLSQRIPLLINGEWRTGPVNHPGTKGKHIFERAIVAADKPAGVAAALAQSTALARLFR